jgi:hypothetical protein
VGDVRTSQHTRDDACLDTLENGSPRLRSWRIASSSKEEGESVQSAKNSRDKGIRRKVDVLDSNESEEAEVLLEVVPVHLLELPFTGSRLSSTRQGENSETFGGELRGERWVDSIS